MSRFCIKTDLCLCERSSRKIPYDESFKNIANHVLSDPTVANPAVYWWMPAHIGNPRVRTDGLLPCLFNNKAS